MSALETMRVSFAKGASQTSGDAVQGVLVGLVTPAAWTSAHLVFQGSLDGKTYFDIFDWGVRRGLFDPTLIPGGGERRIMFFGIGFAPIAVPGIRLLSVNLDTGASVPQINGADIDLLVQR